MREFHHLGMPTDKKRDGELWVEETRVWVKMPDDNPYCIEFLRYEPDSPTPEALKTQPHLAFRTDDLRRDIEGKNVILGPFKPMEGMEVVFIEDDGVVVEFMEIQD